MRRSGVPSAVGWVIVAAVVVRALAELRLAGHYVSAGLGPWGADFHGGAWLAAQQILNGATPYLRPEPSLLIRFPHAFVTPPPLGIVALPLAHLPYGVAVAIWNLVDVVSLALALWLLGVRDLRIYLLAVCSAPFVSSVTSGQVEGLFALLIAAAWRGRASWRGGLAVGGLIAAKLYSAPLVIWLLVTRRFRVAGWACVSAVGVLVVSWAMIGFHGLVHYPSLLNAASVAARNQPGSLSVVTVASALGLSHALATALAAVLTVGLVSAIVGAARGSDAGWLCATLAVGLFASPILWEHYLVLLFVPLAIVQPQMSVPWLLTAAFWLPYSFAPGTVRAALSLLVAVGMTVVATGEFDSRTVAFWPRRRPAAHIHTA